MDGISLILTVHNQENIIYENFKSIIENKSELSKEVIIVLDGCTDNSEQEINRVRCDIPVTKIYTPDLNETMANNCGLRLSKFSHSIIFQDDVRIIEKDYDKRLYKPFTLFDDLLGVTGRDSADIIIKGEKIDFINVAGRDTKTPRNIFSIRQICNRGPIIFDNKKLRELNYFDELFAPIAQDDTDLFLRGAKKGYRCGSYVIDYMAEPQWGGTRKTPQSAYVLEKSEEKNMRIIINRHSDFINKKFYDEDVEIMEKHEE